MLPHSFASFLDRRNQAIPEADRIVPIIAQTGARGMSRGELGGVIGLERDSLDALLDGLVQFGLLTMAQVHGVRVYRVRL